MWLPFRWRVSNHVERSRKRGRCCVFSCFMVFLWNEKSAQDQRWSNRSIYIEHFIHLFIHCSFFPLGCIQSLNDRRCTQTWGGLQGPLIVSITNLFVLWVLWLKHLVESRASQEVQIVSQTVGLLWVFGCTSWHFCPCAVSHPLQSVFVSVRPTGEVFAKWYISSVAGVCWVGYLSLSLYEYSTTFALFSFHAALFLFSCR